MPFTGGAVPAKWNNATQGLDGQIVYMSAAGVADFTTGITLAPEGVLLNKPKQNETAQIVDTPGQVAMVLADGTTNIAVGDLLKSNATGRAVKAAKGGSYVTTIAWVIGHALEACTAADKLIAVKWNPIEGSYT